MHTRVTAPAWTAEGGEGARRVLRAPSWPAGLAVTLYPLWQLPDPPAAQVVPFVERDLPAGGRARVVSTAEARTHFGAPMTIVEAEVTGGDGRTIERRLLAVYQFLEYGGGAMARARDAASLREHAAEIRAVLETGHADFSGHVAALEQLYAGLPEESSWVRS